MPKRAGLPTVLHMRHDAHYVDALTSKTGAPLGRMIALDRIEPNPDQPRQSMGELDELVASIKEKGVLEPILVRYNGETQKFMIISGERRYMASVRAGLKEVPCIEKEATDSEVAEIALIENLQRKDLTAFEEAEGLKSLADRFGYTHHDIAKKIGKSRSSVTEALSINSLPDEIKKSCREAGITAKTMLLEVVRQPSREKMASAIRRMKQQGLTREASRLERKPEAAKRAQNYVFHFMPPSKDFTLDLRFRRSQVEREEVIRALRAILNQLERDSH
ncbi:MAG: ParB/RepB/Spo0J family partition protein [Acidobacteriia bacterium]|nr:ParB/RepB/Spo0J family partition protein [Terriglobia bacterium]